MTAFLSGFLLSLSMIIAIGAQNAFILRQGIRREHVLLVVLVSSISEIVLVSIGVSGFSVVAAAHPWVLDALRYLGAAFVCIYGLIALKSAIWGTGALDTRGAAPASWQSVLATILAVTWLNPHAILDTAVLIGSLSVQYGDLRWVFGFGAILGSILFFFVLGYGARLLAPVFVNPRAWRVLDGIVGLTMLAIAFGLVFAL